MGAGRQANFEFITSKQCGACRRIVLKDLGPWDKHLTITNDIEGVIERLVALVGRTDLENAVITYLDSEGIVTGAEVKKGKFERFFDLT
jgi:hypothetical protein